MATMTATASDLFAAAPWREAPIAINDRRFPAGCLHAHEASLLTILARDYFAGEGAIVDAGAFLGKSSALFAQGLRENQNVRPRPWVHAFDWFRILDAHDVRWIRDVSGEARELGARTRDLYDAKVKPWADLIQVHDGDFTQAVWDGGPIEILFIDICKSEALNRRVIEQFFPALIPGRSIVIQQDYHHGHHPYIHVAMERLFDYLTPLATRIDDSYVCQLKQSIPADVLASAANVWSLSFDQKLALMDSAVDRLPKSERLFVQLARAVLTGSYEGDPAQIDAADLPKWERERTQILSRVVGAQKHAATAAWAGAGQDQEFAFHAENSWRRSPQFTTDSARLWEHFGFRADQFAGQVIVDVGAGSKLRTRYFESARIKAVEPLADRFRTLDFCDLDAADAAFSVPGEVLVPELVNSADVVLSINALDHGYDFDMAIRNIAAYLKPDATAFLSFDLHEHADAMHPLVLTEETCRVTFAKAGLIVTQATAGVGPFGTNYGHGAAINFWLRKPRD